MKRFMITTSLMIALTVMGANSVTAAPLRPYTETSLEVLQRTVKTFNTNKAPTMMPNGMQITKMSLEQDQLVYYINIEGSNINLRTLKAGRKALRKTLLKQYSESNVQDLSSTIPYCRDAGIGVTYVYYNAKGKTLKINFKSTEI